jgi:hypothetical protein
VCTALQVCNSYKYMPNDKAMLQYGFLQVRQAVQYRCTAGVSHAVRYPASQVWGLA